MEYTPPLADIRFVFEDIVGLAELSKLPGFEHADVATSMDLLEGYGRFVADVFTPLDKVGDAEGCTLDTATGAVTTPTGTPEAYKRWSQDGWGSVAFDPVDGGGGFPWLVGLAMQELLTSADMAFSLCPLLGQGAIDMLVHHGSDEQRATFVPRMVSGEWTGTMNLTEPDAGSDVGALRTRAVPADDGTWRITGTKIFITYGEHDLTDNIVHLVLARVPGAPPGTKGISCFIVPKVLVQADGTLGERNDVVCTSIEHKLGIHASPTCVLSFGDGGEGAVGYLIGEANEGMRYMFTMMNSARLGVGVEGLAIAERSYQQAAAYAVERRQGRAVGAPAGQPSSIAGHPDVRRNLLTVRATTESLRMLTYTVAACIDRARHGIDDADRVAAQERADLLTPLAKAWGTDKGVEAASTALQVFGGMGFVEETGIAQRYRDARIAPIYEGTNGIQAIDLVGRKLSMRGGAVLAELLEEVDLVAEELQDGADDLGAAGHALAAAVGDLRTAAAWLLHADRTLDDKLAGATPFLALTSLVVCGWLMGRQALAARRHLAGGAADPAMTARLVTARFHLTQLVPATAGLLPAVTAGAGDLMALTAEQLVAR